MATETEKRRISQARAHACSSLDGQAALARTIGRPEETVSDWANGKALVDPDLVVEIERITGVSRHELRRTTAKLCRAAGGELEQIQLLLGHASVQTTERYLGTRQDLIHAPNDA